MIHQIVFQQTGHPYAAHEQADVSDRYGQYVERRVRNRRKRQFQQPPVEEKQHAAHRERRDDSSPCNFLLLYAFRSQTRECQKYDGEQFRPKDVAEQSGRAVEVQQDSVDHADIQSPFHDLSVTEPVDVDYHEQDTQRPHEIHDFRQTPKVVFLLHNSKFNDE